ncbi:MAG: transglycosylase SLT domain-containing protein [Bryobacteraceae bacterium]
MRLLFMFLLILAPRVQDATPAYFSPAHRIIGIGADRDDLSAEQVDLRAAHMIESQTFAIMREPEALAGARRITADAKLRGLFRSAAEHSGFPVSLLEAVAWLESWGDPHAESPSGPKGIMQISEATARTMGLKVLHATRYHVTREKVAVSTKSHTPKFKTVTHRVPYTVTVRDDRLSPGRAIPAAAAYLAGMEQKFGGRDWAIFAYHCGQGCVGEMLELTRRAHGIPKDQVTVPRMFFSSSPAWNRELYQAVSQQMQRDYSPTYYFRIRRAEQLLDLYRRDPAAFTALQREFKSEFAAGPRAPHRLSVWLRRDDLIFHTGEDIRSAATLAPAFDRPDFFGYSLNLDRGSPSVASPAALGTLAYVAFETRRLYDSLRPKPQFFQPLPVTSLVEAEDALLSSQREARAHASGQVFDIDYSGLPPGELECLRFVLDDLGWDGYLGFVEEGSANLHIGCSPSSRDFFTAVYQEALEAR